VLRHKEGGYAWGDGTVPSSIAMNAWYSSHRDRHYAPSVHTELLKSRAFLEYVKSIIDNAQARTEVALMADPESRRELLTTYAAVNAFAYVPINAARWTDLTYTAATEFNNELLSIARVDLNSLIATAEKKDDREMAATLAVAATAKAATPLQKAQAAQAVAKTQLALWDWAGAADSVGAATSLAQAVDSKEQREAILRSAYHIGGWANLQLGQSEKGTSYLVNAERLGNVEAFKFPLALGEVPRQDFLSLPRYAPGPPGALPGAR
jgi:hypothetical protein